MKQIRYLYKFTGKCTPDGKGRTNDKGNAEKMKDGYIYEFPTVICNSTLCTPAALQILFMNYL